MSRFVVLRLSSVPTQAVLIDVFVCLFDIFWCIYCQKKFDIFFFWLKIILFFRQNALLFFCYLNTFSGHHFLSTINHWNIQYKGKTIKHRTRKSFPYFILAFFFFQWSTPLPADAGRQYEVPVRLTAYFTFFVSVSLIHCICYKANGRP